jgi:hypothetical protein
VIEDSAASDPDSRRWRGGGKYPSSAGGNARLGSPQSAADSAATPEHPGGSVPEARPLPTLAVILLINANLDERAALG